MDMNRLFSLTGRVALVTGASRGLGRMIAEGFLMAGAARVYVTARGAGQLAAVTDALGENCLPLVGDLSTGEGVEAIAAALGRREERLDILVNNAGGAWSARFEDFPQAEWDRVLALNLRAPFYLTQRLHGLLKAAGRPDRPAKVIHIASADGLKPNPWETYPYQASKAALLQLTRRMAARLASDHIIVNAIAPGMFATKMNRAAARAGDAVAAHIPARRLGDAEDMAGAAIYLASRAGDYVMGSTLVVDGGWVNATVPTDFVSPGGE